MYQHKDIQGEPISLPVGKVVCIGRNYLDHIDEMKSEVPTEPLLFMKPKAALCDLTQPLVVPKERGECHNELEVAILLNKPLINSDIDSVNDAIWGVGLALDLTLRDVQASLKDKGQPWERAKAFDLSCPVSGFIPVSRFTQLQNLSFSLHINNELRQQGNTSMMLHSIAALIAHMSSVFSLEAGDIILTGTPKGVGPLLSSDRLTVSLHDHFDITTTVAE